MSGESLMKDYVRKVVGRRDDWETTYRASVMFGGCISYYGVGTLTPGKGNRNTEKYISVLNDNLWPVITRHFSNRLWIFQEDNAPCHISVRTNQWKAENYINPFLGQHTALI